MAKIPIPVTQKKIITLIDKLGYTMSNETGITNAKFIDNMYIDGDGNLVVVSND